MPLLRTNHRRLLFPKRETKRRRRAQNITPLPGRGDRALIRTPVSHRKLKMRQTDTRKPPKKRLTSLGGETDDFSALTVAQEVEKRLSQIGEIQKMSQGEKNFRRWGLTLEVRNRRRVELLKAARTAKTNA